MTQKEPDVLTGEMCPFCHQKTLTLMESELEVPFFGMCFVFSMDCSSCKYHKADVEAAEEKEPVKFTLEIEKEEDMRVRVIKSANGKVTIPYVGTIEPGEAANGYITNVEGIFNRIKKQVEFLRDDADEEEDRKKAKNLLKKLTKIMWGQEKAKLIIEDPSGNSAIISDRAKKEKLKK